MNNMKIRVFHQGAVCAQRTATHDEIPTFLRALSKGWHQYREIPGRLAVVLDDPDGVSHIMATSRGVS